MCIRDSGNGQTVASISQADSAVFDEESRAEAKSIGSYPRKLQQINAESAIYGLLGLKAGA